MSVTDPAQSFDRLIRLATALFEAPAAMVSVIRDRRTVFHSMVGLEAQDIAYEDSITRLVMEQGAGGMLVIEDGLADPLSRTHPMVTGEPHLRWFAGVAIADASGKTVGALGVMDNKARPRPSERQLDQLKNLAELAGEMFDRAREARQLDSQISLLTMAEQMSGVGHWRYDIDSQQIDWSSEVYRIYGRTPDAGALTLEDVARGFGPKSADRLRAAVKRACETGEGYEFRLPMEHANGDILWVVAKASTLKDETGRVTGLYGVLQDVTEQEASLARLTRSEERYRLLAEHTGDVIARVRKDGTSKYISPAIQPMLGWRYEDMSGQSMDYVHPEDRAKVLAVIADTIKHNDRRTLQHRALSRDGRTVWVECHFQNIAETEYELGEVVVVIRDIDERKALEAELTAQKERAEGAARTKSAFLANMSHELRTPLTSVIGFSGLLKQSRALGPEERRYVDRIAAGSEALLSVINDILDYSKLEAGAVDMDPAPFDPRVLVTGVVDLIEGQAQARGLKLEVEVTAAVPPAMMGDVDRLRQVLLNFMSNAVKFTASGRVSLVLDATVDDDGAAWLAASVSDTGIGISSDMAVQLFERFVQADASTTRTYGGTGLGLAISRQLIEMMGGEIGAHGLPGEGSTFWFRVPLQAVEPGVRQAAVESTTAVARGRVLVADDAAANRELVGAILGNLGLEVVAVENGVEAVDAARMGGFDLILMDVHMPVMDGLNATRAIRQGQGQAALTPILALTANVGRDQVEMCLNAGMNGHLAKPIEISRLVEALGAWLGARGTADPVAVDERAAESG